MMHLPSIARLACVAVAAGAMLTGCAAAMPLAPAASTAAGLAEDVDDVSRSSLLDAKPSVSTRLDSTRVSLLIDGVEITDISVGTAFSLTQALSATPTASGAPAGKPQLGTADFTVGGYNDALTKWYFAQRSIDVPQLVSFVYYSSSSQDVKKTELARVTFKQPQITEYTLGGSGPESGGEGKVSRVVFAASAVSVTSATIDPKGLSVPGKAYTYDFETGKYSQEVLRNNALNKIAASLNTHYSAVLLDGVEVGNAVPTQDFKLTRDYVSGKGGLSEGGKPKLGPAAFSVPVSINEALSAWVFTAPQPKPVAFVYYADPAHRTELGRITFGSALARDYGLSAAGTTLGFGANTLVTSFGLERGQQSVTGFDFVRNVATTK